MKKYLLLLLFPIIAFANIGKISVLRGDVTITRDGHSLKAKSGTTLEKKDFIKTAKNAKVQIIFNDKTIFTIGKNSTLDIADYLYDESKPSNNRAKFNVLKGAFTSITGRIGKLNKKRFKLRTKSASIGIRGTIVKANQETIMCTEGAITVTTPNGVSVDVEAGSKTNVASGTATKPEAIKDGDEDQMGADVTKEDEEVSKEQSKKEESQSSTKTTDKTESEVVEKEVVQPIIVESVVDTNPTVKKTGYSVRSGIDNSDFNADIDIVNNKGTTGSSDSLTVLNPGDATSWGYWNDSSSNIDKRSVWVAGTKTEVGVIDSLRNSAKPITSTYNGQVIGSVKDHQMNTFDNIKLDANNKVNMKFTLGGTEPKFEGSIKFKTDSGSSWDSSWTSGSTNKTSFTASSVGGTGDGRAISAETSKVEGSFYGDNAQDVAGQFKLNTANYKNENIKTASGVFKASK